ncbi:MAG: SIR2 family protein [Verrucomicrobia bacterium]|nr:SIR2 family protein [Verrucomicrobiota bacterium]
MYEALSTYSAEDIAVIMKSKPVLLVGSAISMFPPTNICSGIQFCNQLYEYIFFEEEFKELLWLREEVNGIPFEAIMECYPNRQELPHILSSIFNIDRDNPFHRLLAEKLVNGEFAAIVTPNYDSAFDKVLSIKKDFHRIVYKEDANKYYSHPELPIYFKIHGTAEDENTIIYTLSQETILEEWKEKLLQSLINDRVVIVVGYSGRDFDICPFIAKLESKKILWLHYSGNPSAYQNYILRSKSTNVCRSGSFQDFAKLFFSEEIILRPAKNEFHPEKYFKLDRKKIYEWRLNILNRIACASVGLPLLKKLNGILDQHKLLVFEAGMRGHTGEYKKQARLFYRLSKQHSPTSKERINGIIASAGCWLNGSYYFQFLFYLRKAERVIVQNYSQDVEVISSLLQLKLSFWMKVNQILKRRLFQRRIFGGVHKYVSNKIIPLKKKIDSLSLANGLDTQQGFQQIFDRLGIEQAGITSLKSFIGFKNLGLSGMALIAYRDKMRYNDWDETDEKGPFGELDNCIQKAEDLGMCTELWKHCRIKFKRGLVDKGLQKEIWKQWKVNLSKTEYGIIRHLYERMDLYKSYVQKFCFDFLS